jgi:hypothetical protein
VSDMPAHAPSQTEVPPPSARHRAAWVIVIIMSTLLVLALLGTIFGFLRQAHIFLSARSATHAAAAPDAPAAATILLAPGARILSAQTASGKLVLHVATPSGSEVEIVDLATGKLTAQVKANQSPDMSSAK